MIALNHLKTAYAATVTALLLMVAMLVTTLLSGVAVGQELFETIFAVDDYTAALLTAEAPLRVILFIDGLFMLAYTVAIGAAMLGFRQRNPAAALAGGLGIIAVMLLDALENATMAQSLDLIAAGGTLTLERIAFQASVSAMKWQAAAATLVAASFVFPTETTLEKALVWAARLGLPVAVPIFVMNPLGVREAGALLMLLSMVAGFVLLALTLRTRTARNP